MALTLADANRAIQASIAKADEMGIKVSAAVCDAGGRLIAFNRMDGAIWASTYGAQGKAVTSAAFGRPSGAVAADSPTARAIADVAGGMIPGGQGAVPILRDGVVEGACGVGGGTSQQDEDCAAAGVAVL
jgi:glc operon protein GlcG